VLALEPRNAFDDRNTAVTGGGNGPYYMVRSTGSMGVTNGYLLAILNHPLSEALIRTETSTFGGGYYSHGKQYIQSLPVPIPDDATRDRIDGLVADAIDELDLAKQAGTPHQRDVHRRRFDDLRRQIEHQVSALFGLTPDDLAIINAVPVPS